MVWFRVTDPRRKFARKQEKEFRGDAKVTQVLKNGTVQVKYGRCFYTVSYENLRKKPTQSDLRKPEVNPPDSDAEEPMPPVCLRKQKTTATDLKPARSVPLHSDATTLHSSNPSAELNLVPPSDAGRVHLNKQRKRKLPTTLQITAHEIKVSQYLHKNGKDLPELMRTKLAICH